MEKKSFSSHEGMIICLIARKSNPVFGKAIYLYSIILTALSIVIVAFKLIVEFTMDINFTQSRKQEIRSEAADFYSFIYFYILH